MNKKQERLLILSLDICMRTIDYLIKTHEDKPKDEIIAVFIHMIEGEARRRYDV